VVQYGGRGGDYNGKEVDQTLKIDGTYIEIKTNWWRPGGKARSVIIIETSEKSNQYIIQVTSRSKAQESIGVIDKVIKRLDEIAARYGAKQNELEKIISNNETMNVNTRSAEDRIRNIDFAKEIAELTKNNILMESTTAMLSQANIQSQMVLELLK
jgi:flagellin